MSKSKVQISGPSRSTLMFDIASAKLLAQNNAKQIPLLDEQLNRLTDAAEDIERQAHRLHELADRLFGMDSVEGKAGEPIPSPLSSIGKLNDAHERLSLARGSLAAAVNRLEVL